MRNPYFVYLSLRGKGFIAIQNHHGYREFLRNNHFLIGIISFKMLPDTSLYFKYIVVLQLTEKSQL